MEHKHNNKFMLDMMLYIVLYSLIQRYNDLGVIRLVIGELIL